MNINKLRIQPIPTQKQRKAIKKLPHVSRLIVDGDEAWVYTPFEERMIEVGKSLAKLGFFVMVREQK